MAIHAIFMPPNSTTIRQIVESNSAELAERTTAWLHWLNAA